MQRIGKLNLGERHRKTPSLASSRARALSERNAGETEAGIWWSGTQGSLVDPRNPLPRHHNQEKLFPSQPGSNEGCSAAATHQTVFVYIHQHCTIRGAMFDQDSRVIQSAFLHAIQHYSQNTAGRRLQLHAFVGIISMADAFKISRLM
ncbi:hypothetical protein O3P69_006269 [Scylla paramamosain]|uniref:Uncharacterized protein n=1 Tax=Scylla paramamosain TaxID=85552 RepID=A0AAW0UAW5_SCYPA